MRLPVRKDSWSHLACSRTVSVGFFRQEITDARADAEDGAGEADAAVAERPAVAEAQVDVAHAGRELPRDAAVLTGAGFLADVLHETDPVQVVGEEERADGADDVRGCFGELVGGVGALEGADGAFDGVAVVRAGDGEGVEGRRVVEGAHPLARVFPLRAG